jgi:DNA-binding MarR family transcriptional regulator
VLTAGLSPLAFGASPSSSASFSVSLSATPAHGIAPLVVSFTTTVLSGTPTGYNWSFGDASYWNGSGAGFADAVHEYAYAGLFNATVVVLEGATQASSSIEVGVGLAPLVLRATAYPVSGPAPLTVLFNGSVAGGSGTYRTFDWTFGDQGVGSGLQIRHTYNTSGEFVAILNVTDTAGNLAQVRAYVNVTTAPVRTTPDAPSTLWASPVWPLLGAFLLGIVLATAIALLVRPGLLRRNALESTATLPALELARGPIREPAPAALPAASRVVANARAPLPAPSQPVNPEALRLSQRVVLHLARLGALQADEIASEGFTQAGMAAAVGSGQNVLTNVLRRLEAAGVVVSDVRHVRGRPRRVKVYRLTPRGEALAHDLRRPTGTDGEGAAGRA